MREDMTKPKRPRKPRHLSWYYFNRPESPKYRTLIWAVARLMFWDAIASIRDWAEAKERK